jgi:hypothetical protein
MTARLEFSAILGRKVRVEGWAEQGVSSLAETRLSIEQRAPGEALEMLDCYLAEARWIYEGYFAWVGDLVHAIGEREGAALWGYLARAHAHLVQMAMPTLPLEIVERVVGVPAHAIELTESGTAYRQKDSGSTLPASRWFDIGKEHELLLRQAIAAGERERSLALLGELHRQHKPLHDAYSDWIWLWMTQLAERWGESTMYEMMMESGRRLRTAGILATPSIPVEEQVRLLAAGMRGHRSGPGEEGDIRVSEDAEKYIVEFDPCGSGGRMRRWGQIDNLPPRDKSPFNLGLSQETHPMSWGRTGVPYYCTHCAAYAEILSTDLIGYPSRVTLFDPNGRKPCSWAFYKRPEDIPEQYFTRIGRTRDPANFKKKSE